MSAVHTSVQNSIILRLRIEDQPGLLARAVSTIAEAGGNIGAIDIVRYEKGFIIRDVTVDTTGTEQARTIAEKLGEVDGIDVMHSSDRVFVMHPGGKIEVCSKVPLSSHGAGTACTRMMLDLGISDIIGLDPGRGFSTGGGTV